MQVRERTPHDGDAMAFRSSPRGAPRDSKSAFTRVHSPSKTGVTPLTTRMRRGDPVAGIQNLGHEGNSRRGVGGDRFDDEAVLASARVRRPPPVALVVAAVVAREPRRIELRHRDCVLAQLEQRLQRAACVDFAVVVEREPNDLKHARDPRVGLVGVCGPRRPLREFDNAPRESAGRYDASDTRGLLRTPRVIEPSYRPRYLTIVNKEWRLARTFPRRR